MTHERPVGHRAPRPSWTAISRLGGAGRRAPCGAGRGRAASRSASAVVAPPKVGGRGSEWLVGLVCERYGCDGSTRDPPVRGGGHAEVEREQHLTAEEMEAELAGKNVGYQAHQFANLAIDHYNIQNIVKIELCTVLLSNCFHEICGSTYAHVNFTARARDDNQAAKKRLYFAELKLNQELLWLTGCEPMCVTSVHNLDDSCFGGCHEINRKIDYVMSGNQDYERCYSCSDRIKHPYGTKFVAGHDSSKIPYYTAG